MNRLKIAEGLFSLGVIMEFGDTMLVVADISCWGSRQEFSRWEQ